MTKFTALISCLALSSSFALSKPTENQKFSVTKFKLIGTEGGSLEYKDIKGKVVVLDFCASWCKSCKKNLGILYDIVKSKKSFVTLYTISEDESLEMAKDYFSKLPKELESLRGKATYFDPEAKFGTQLNVEGLPTSILIGQDGTIVENITGLLTDKQIKEFNDSLDSLEKKGSKQ